ncbi:hypothetical protein E5D57_013496 [Metarhizium anisopliae]|nr:hypothetical protein E5D57_013496 [Metarhizium anisopliae]
MIAVVPPDWRFLFVGSSKSVFTVGRGFGIQIQQALGKIDLKVLPEPWVINTDEDQARLLADVRFYDEFLPEAAWILKYNRESILCSNSEISLNDWLDYSWAGAARPEDQGFAGYGGLSLRRVSSIKKVLGFQKRHNNSEPEDEWLGKRIMSMPGEKVANGSGGVFAVENSLADKPMGYYAPKYGRGLNKDVWRDSEARKKILEYCPELHIIMDMKMEQERCPGDNRQGDIVKQSNIAELTETSVEAPSAGTTE